VSSSSGLHLGRDLAVVPIVDKIFRPPRAGRSPRREISLLAQHVLHRRGRLAPKARYNVEVGVQGRIEQADKLEAKVMKLRQLTGRERDSIYVSL
jgi:hypothetical protein